MIGQKVLLQVDSGIKYLSQWNNGDESFYFDLFEVDEAEEVNTIFKNPRLLFLVKFAQGLYHDCFHRWPKNAKIFFSAEEVEAVHAAVALAQAKNNMPTNESQTESPAIRVSSEEKTLASRWMTEQYHRMTDDVLVEIVSKKIWPQLQDEVDGLQWTPAKRALPTFHKTKNMMAACILFHALELSGIAKLPKQEKDDYNYEGLYGEDDRLQTGVVSTSKLRAGITSTKKKYNDTLPVGYMEVLEGFIKEDELPGRTTSRTYLKLLNKWVKMKYESIKDNIDSEASAKLFIAELKEDLGPQFYLWNDNRVRLKALLKEWRDQTPELFNVPI